MWWWKPFAPCDCWFETPPLSTVRCCLAMFLDTYVRDCLSTCWAPAAVNKCSALLSPLPLPPLLGPQCSKPILLLCTMTVWLQLWYPLLKFSLLMTLCGLVEGAGHHLCTSKLWLQWRCTDHAGQAPLASVYMTTCCCSAIFSSLVWRQSKLLQ